MEVNSWIGVSVFKLHVSRDLQVRHIHQPDKAVVGVRHDIIAAWRPGGPEQYRDSIESKPIKSVYITCHRPPNNLSTISCDKI